MSKQHYISQVGIPIAYVLSNLVACWGMLYGSPAEGDDQREAGDAGADPATAAPFGAGRAAPARKGEQHGGAGEGAPASGGGAASAGGGPRAAAGQQWEAAQVQQTLPGCEGPLLFCGYSYRQHIWNKFVLLSAFSIRMNNIGISIILQIVE